MVRIWLAFLLVLFPIAAHADTIATYRLAGGGTLIIEAADDGASRVETSGPGSAGAPLLIGAPDGTLFVVMKQRERVSTMRFEDVTAVISEVLTPLMAQMPALPAEVLAARFEARGQRQVGSRSGSLYSLQPPTPANAKTAPRPLNLVISADPALAKVGRVLARIHDGVLGIEPLSRIAPPAIRQVSELMRTGALLQLDEEVVLSSVEERAIGRARFALQTAPPLAKRSESWWRRSSPPSRPLSRNPLRGSRTDRGL